MTCDTYVRPTGKHYRTVCVTHATVHQHPTRLAALNDALLSQQHDCRRRGL